MLDLIRNRQKELENDAKAKEELASKLREEAVQMFSDTNIPAMWDSIKDIKVPHWRIQESRDGSVADRDLVPLLEHMRTVTDTSISVLGWNGKVTRKWAVKVTDKNSVVCQITRDGMVYNSTVEEMRNDFVDYMAKLLPPV